jgi:hypothetical protein
MMMPDAFFRRHIATVFLQNVLCLGKTQWTLSDDDLAGQFSLRVLCMKGL